MRIALPIAFVIAAVLAWAYFKFIKQDHRQAKAIVQLGTFFLIIWIIIYWFLFQ
jgi:hypothetical protein